MKKISILYMSGADIAIPLLEALVSDSRFEVKGLLSFPDKPKGRGQKIELSLLKQCAQDHHIPIYFERENVPKADMALSFAYGAIVPLSFLDEFPYALNVHTSLLPKYRGASPIQSAILHGDLESGITLMSMEKEMDTGAIWTQHAFSIENLHAGQVFQKMADLAAETIPDDLASIDDGLIHSHPQEGPASYCQKIHKNHGFIHFDEEALVIEKKFLAYTPWPGLWSIWGDKRVKWLALKSSDKTLKEIEIHGNILSIPCSTGSVTIESLQVEGKKAMDIATFKQAYSSLLKESFLKNIKY